MRKPANMHKFVSRVELRERKVAALAAINTPESRKAKKAMNVQWHGKHVATDVKGFYGRKHPVKVKVSAKTRRSLSAMKGIMRLQY